MRKKTRTRRRRTF